MEKMMSQTLENFLENLAKDELVLHALKRYNRLDNDHHALVINREFTDYEARKALLAEIDEKMKIEENNLHEAILAFFVYWCHHYLHNK